MNDLYHVAFIMDGNGRWGIKKKNSRNFGHKEGVKVVKRIVSSSIKLKIPFVTFYVFSSENWKRPKKETIYLFKLIKNYFLKEIERVVREGIKINVIGEMYNIPKDTKLALNKAKALTKHNKKICVNLAINYGSHNEIIQACKKTSKNINYRNFKNKLYTKDMPYPDILIRTGGYQRLSNFMLWQLAYTELYFLKKMWPDFNERDLKNILKKFKNLKRNYGKI